MNWYSFGVSGVDLTREEWKTLIDTPEDLDSLTKLGTGVNHDCMAAFNVMLVGIATAKGIDVRPEQFRDKMDEKRMKQPSLTPHPPESVR